MLKPSRFLLRSAAVTQQAPTTDPIVPQQESVTSTVDEPPVNLVPETVTSTTVEPHVGVEPNETSADVVYVPVKMYNPRLKVLGGVRLVKQKDV